MTTTPVGGSAELWRALGAVAESMGADAELSTALELPPLDPVAQTSLFVIDLPPYASRYLSADGMLGGEAADRVAGLWRAIGVPPPPEPDHLASLAGLYASVMEAEASAEGSEAARRSLRQVRHALFWEHLATWLPPYLVKVGLLGDLAQRRWAELLLGSLASEARELGGARIEPMAWRQAPAAVVASGPPQELVEALLVPLWGGLFLTRVDLAKGARQTSLGLRLGERRYVLQGLLNQDPEQTLTWLLQEARSWAGALSDLPEELDQCRRFWEERAGATGAAAQSLLRATSAPGPTGRTLPGQVDAG